jgi:hypothetical protein
MNCRNSIEVAQNGPGVTPSTTCPRLLTHLQLINPDRELAGKIIREIARREGDQGMSINQIADATGIPRSNLQRWAKKAEEG